MTREEAIELIEHMSIAFVPTDQYGDYDDPQPYEEATNMAIEALSTELVHCKDCRQKHIGGSVTHYYWCDLWDREVDGTDYCAWAEESEVEE